MPARLPALLTFALAAAVLAAVLAVTERPASTHPRITTTLLWNREIAPILQRRCFACHTPNNVAFPLTTFAEARPWAAAIREEVLTRHMPPWAAVAGYGHFRNDPSLTQGEWDLLVAWVDGGAPSGQLLEEEAVPTVFVPTAASWEHGEPDAVVAVPGQMVPGGGPDRVVRLELSTGLTTARRVRGLAFKPGDRRVVRAASVFEAGSGRWLFSWTPWATSLHLPEGVAFPLKAGSTLIVEISYRGTEQDTTDASELGLYFEEAASGPAAGTLRLQAPAVNVPAGARAVRIRGELVLDAAAALYAVYPEPGSGTRSVELTAYLPDGSVRPLLWLHEYRADWPSPYVYTDAVSLPRGTRLVMTTYVDNAGTAATSVQPRLHLIRVPAGATTF